MSSQATARTQQSETAPSGLDFYRTRDEMVRAYQPATEEERLLVTQIARAWLRLQQFYEFETKALAQHDLMDLFTNDLDRYKLLTRGIAESERMWRNAVEMFHSARRRRAQASAAPQIRPRSRRPIPFPENDPRALPRDPYNTHEELTCSSVPIERASNSTAAPSS